MLAVAISCELIAFAAVFGLGGRSLGLSVLALAALLLGISLLLDRKQVVHTRTRRTWTYFMINDRLGRRSQMRQRIAPMLWKPVADRTGFIPTLGLQNRWNRSFGEN